MQFYDHKKIEKKWQKEWEKKKIYKTLDSSKKKKYYILDMFPYPSGEGLHVGHPKGYIATDIISRMKRMQGLNILHPMGFDAFGLPAENYAIKTKTNPFVSVAQNVARYKKQLEILGFDYDWSREVNTTDPKFYKWTQWIFLKLLEKGLAYESYEPINWCPSCKTGLANEDLEDGNCERCNSVIEQKPMRQWVLKITDYADRLLKDLDSLDWPESIKESQRNWIGKSEGAEIEFKISDVGRQNSPDVQRPKKIKVFTTRPDTIFGATYAVLAPEHELVKTLKIENRDEVEKYIKLTRSKTEIERTAEGKEKTGIELKGIRAINPATKEEISVWIADYVLLQYGTGSIMAVPAHDQRDFEFAKKYNLLVQQVIMPDYLDVKNSPRSDKKNTKRKVVHIILRNKKDKTILIEFLKGDHWGKDKPRNFIIGGVEDDESEIVAATREIKEETGYTNVKFIEKIPLEVQARFFAAHKDVNRTVHVHTLVFNLVDLEQKEISEEEKELHDLKWISENEVENVLTIPDDKIIWKYFLSGGFAYIGEGILTNSGKFNGMDSEEVKKKIIKFIGGKEKTTFKLRDWVFSRQRYWGEPIPVLHDGDKIIPVKEKDLPIILPEVKSYEPTGTGESPLADISDWVNVKGGFKRETNTMPQWAGSSWYYLRYMDPNNDKALVGKDKEKYWNQIDFYVGGAEHATRHLIYARFWHKFLYDIGAVSTLEPFKKLQSVGLIIGEDGRKMSKRFGNVVNPDDIIKTYGADTLRLYEMFMGPFDQSISWSSEAIIGPRRFLEKVWKIGHRKFITTSDIKLKKVLHKTIKKVSEDIENMHFNTAISAMMILASEIEKALHVSIKDFQMFLQILAPFAPHITEELWLISGEKKSIHISTWPSFDSKMIIDDEIKIVIQVNGKVRGEIMINKEDNEDKVKEEAFKNGSIAKYLVGQKVKKTIYIKNRLINIVI